MASKPKMDSLDPKHQEIIRATAAEIRPVWRKLVVEKTAEAKQLCESKGMTVQETNYQAFRSSVQPVYDEFRPTIGTELVDKFMKETSV